MYNAYSTSNESFENSLSCLCWKDLYNDTTFFNVNNQKLIFVLTLHLEEPDKTVFEIKL